MESRVPLGNDEKVNVKFNEDGSNFTSTVDQILAFAEYIVVVLFVHFIILTISFYFVENEDYFAFIAAILITSFVIFLMNYENNPYPKDETETSNSIYQHPGE